MMNIQPTSTDPMPPQTPPAATTRAQVKRELRQAFQEQFAPDTYQQIQDAWKANPDMRTDVLEQAKQLSSDPNYPTPAQLQQLATMIVGTTLSMPPTTEPPAQMPPVAGTPDPTPVVDPSVSAA